MESLPHPITPALLAEAMSGEAYQLLFEDKVAQGATTGPNQSAFMTEYTRLNLQRTQRVREHLRLSDDLTQALLAVPEDWYWVVISEIWCGDAAQCLPLIYTCVARQPRINLRVILRDEYPEAMDHFANGGSRAIPILACIRQQDMKLLGHWGPRPQPAQAIVTAHKANPTKPDAEMYEDLHRWYARDKTVTQQQEFAALIRHWSQA
ncbi:MAG: thioredoxin family protein [Bacteroidetes bacterium]|nr:thioredoxin family protein [Bacteroidota bacterium]